MTDEQIRVAVAERCGWHSIKSIPCNPLNPALWGCMPDYKATAYPTDLVPDYLNSLDAMAEARKLIKAWQAPDYNDALLTLTGGADKARTWVNIWAIVTATPRQHALAFLACFPEPQQAGAEGG